MLLMPAHVGADRATLWCSDSEDESVVDSDEAEEEGSEDDFEDEEEEGKDWDELEEEAKRYLPKRRHVTKAACV